MKIIVNMWKSLKIDENDIIYWKFMEITEMYIFSSQKHLKKHCPHNVFATMTAKPEKIQKYSEIAETVGNNWK